MSILIVGTTALDSIKTPQSENPRLLGGSASHAAVAASFFAPVSLLGVVGDDFPEEYITLYKKHKIDLAGLERAPGNTFHWEGEYEVNMNNRQTLETDLGVIENWAPTLSDTLCRQPFVLLANCAPQLQHHVLRQTKEARFVIADTMDLWLNIARHELESLLKEIDCLVLNDSEARQLMEEDNVVLAAQQIHRYGPKYVIVKKGEHGSVLSGPNGLFIAPAFPLNKVIDPTGAGDSFVGGLVGYLASHPGEVETNLHQAIIHGSVTASFCCEGFGLAATTEISMADIQQRMEALKSMVAF
ncbi:MAG: PfkB family carbohydrate kinase [Verrucomicrobiota bacterium]|jgi:cytidine kinase|nr:PfkB family carbohydrate kinase [Verrucomicrobiota bacterium]